jgi:hypothetical protein
VVVSREKDLMATTNIGVVINDKNLLFVTHERATSAILVHPLSTPAGDSAHCSKGAHLMPETNLEIKVTVKMWEITGSSRCLEAAFPCTSCEHSVTTLISNARLTSTRER